MLLRSSVTDFTICIKIGGCLSERESCTTSSKNNIDENL